MQYNSKWTWRFLGLIVSVLITGCTDVFSEIMTMLAIGGLAMSAGGSFLNAWMSNNASKAQIAEDRWAQEMNLNFQKTGEKTRQRERREDRSQNLSLLDDKVERESKVRVEDIERQEKHLRRGERTRKEERSEDIKLMKKKRKEDVRFREKGFKLTEDLQKFNMNRSIVNGMTNRMLEDKKMGSNLVNIWGK